MESLRLLAVSLASLASISPVQGNLGEAENVPGEAWRSEKLEFWIPRRSEKKDGQKSFATF